MTFLEKYMFEHSDRDFVWLCPADCGYEDGGNDGCYKLGLECYECWERECPGSGALVITPNYIAVNDREGYVDVDAFRIKVEDGIIVGVYTPNGIEADPATTIMKVVEIDPGIRELVDICGGHCPCTIEKNEDTLCPCKEFREQTEPGECRCGRYEKVVVE